MKVAFFGTGLMGTGFVRRMLANGHQVNVWNRSPDKARALAEHVAPRPSTTPAARCRVPSASTWRCRTMPLGGCGARAAGRGHFAGHLDR